MRNEQFIVHGVDDDARRPIIQLLKEVADIDDQDFDSVVFTFHSGVSGPKKLRILGEIANEFGAWGERY